MITGNPFPQVGSSGPSLSWFPTNTTRVYGEASVAHGAPSWAKRSPITKVGLTKVQSKIEIERINNGIQDDTRGFNPQNTAVWLTVVVFAKNRSNKPINLSQLDCEVVGGFDPSQKYG